MTRKAGPKVFVVYEDNLIGTTLVAFLERNGYRATAFKSPLNALEAARSDAPDILVQMYSCLILAALNWQF
jgi:DNA-binding response OmpR family regulator